MPRPVSLILCVGVGCLAFAAGPATQSSAQAPRRAYTTWSAYGGTTDQIGYSSLEQIDRSNVSQLTQVWTYDSGETGGLQTQPIVADGVLYGYTPTHKTFALNAATGEQLWTFDPGIEGQRTESRRDVLGQRRRPPRVRRGRQYLYALDAAHRASRLRRSAMTGRIDLRREPRPRS